jgi:glyoxylase-like metal-dependent hydrolase (beta-lactamase superfamily II)
LSSVAIHTLDLHFQGNPETIASFLVIGPEGPVLVETGPGSTLPSLERGLAQYGFTPDDVHDILLTHIHLDHAGAAGWWAQRGARLHVHQLGASHLIRPIKLMESAQRIYGDQMERLWGQFLPAPAGQVHEVQDGDVIVAGGLKFTAFDTPGHARHHLVYRLGGVAFVGDLGGIRLAGRPYLRVPTPPPDFDPPAWLASVERMRARRFSRLYLTHFGPVDEVDAHWEAVENLVQEVTDLVRREVVAGLDRAAVTARFTEWELARQGAHGLDPEAQTRYNSLGAAQIAVNGIVRYLNKLATPN